ncbi:MAG: hypothetical protein WBI12_05295 [Methanosarcina flavescens]
MSENGISIEFENLISQTLSSVIYANFLRKSLITSLLKKGLSENPEQQRGQAVQRLVINTNFLRKSLITSLLKKGLSENSW